LNTLARWINSKSVTHRRRLSIFPIPERWHAVPERWHAMPERWHAVPERWHAMPERWHAMPERWHAVPEGWHGVLSHTRRGQPALCAKIHKGCFCSIGNSFFQGILPSLFVT